VSQNSILLIHSDAGVTALLKGYLSKKHKNISSVNSFLGLKKILSKTIFNTIITDVSLDGTAGNSMIQFLNEQLPNAKIIVLTDMDQQIVRQEISALGIEAFFDFPIDLSQLEQAIIT
jgi:DNA-binding NtrC family response regulator